MAGQRILLMVYKIALVFALLLMLAGCGVESETTQLFSEGGQSYAAALGITDNNEEKETTQQLSEGEQSLPDVLVIPDPSEELETTQQPSEDEQNEADMVDIADQNEQQEVKQLSEEEQNEADTVDIANQNEQQEVKQLSEEEQSIAEVLIFIAHNMFNMEGSGEYYILTLLEDAIVEVSFVPGYFWRWSGHYNEELVAIAPDGITCWLRPPEPSWEGYIYWVILIGKKDDNTYYDNVYAWYPDACSIEEHIGYGFLNQPLEDIIQTFELYIPPRES